MPALQAPVNGIFETHAHLTSDAFDADREAALERARDAGVAAITNIGSGYGFDGNQGALDFVSRYRPLFPNLYATVGIHPHEAGEVGEERYDALIDMAQQDCVVAFGECGLDYFHLHAPKDVQHARFRDCIRMALQVDLPLVIHDRDAHEDVLDILEAEGAHKVGGIFHCFAGDTDHAKRAIAMNFVISIPGIVTFPKATVLQQVVRDIPLEKMVIETDCPYLTPIPYRGKRNEPAYLPHIASKIAELKAPLTAEDVVRITSLNAQRVFKLGEHTEPQIAYRIRNSLYLNLTNRCTIHCKFCGKFKDYTVKGHYLKLPEEPSADALKAAVGDPKSYEEVVFCGYGEPTLRLDVIKEVGRWVKAHGGRVRLNTDGLGCLVHGRDILPDLDGAVDMISVSLNAPDSDSYDKWCPSAHKGKAYPAVKDFIRRAVARFDVTATAVGLPGQDVEECRRIAENELGAKFRFRPYDELG